MNCPACGLENPPVHEACAFCATPIDPAERREEWERLTPALRDEFSKNFARALESRRAWREKLRRNRVHHGVMGACLGAFLCSATLVPASGSGFDVLYLLMDAALGAGAGFALNHVRGGEYQGMGLFGGAFAVSTVARMALGDLALSFFFGFFVFPGFLAALSLGYLFGLNLSLRRTIED